MPAASDYNDRPAIAIGDAIRRANNKKMDGENLIESGDDNLTGYQQIPVDEVDLTPTAGETKQSTAGERIVCIGICTAKDIPDVRENQTVTVIAS